MTKTKNKKLYAAVKGNKWDVWIQRISERWIH